MITPARASIRRSSSRRCARTSATVRFLGTEVVNARPELKQWGVGSPAKVPLDQLITERGTYDPFKRMRFDAHYPIVSGYDQKAGVRLLFPHRRPAAVPPVQRQPRRLALRQSTAASGFTLNLEYQTPNWKLTYWHNLADVYDLAGPVLRSRKGDAFIAELHQAADLRSAAPARRVRLGRGLFRARRSCPARRTSPARSDLQSAEIGLKYTNTTKALGGVDHEKGIDGADRRRHRPGRGPFLPEALRRRRRRHRAAVAQQLGVALRRMPASSAASATARSPLIISARSATITSMTGRRSATARWKASPASTSTRSPRASSPR